MWPTTWIRRSEHLTRSKHSSASRFSPRFRFSGADHVSSNIFARTRWAAGTGLIARTLTGWSEPATERIGEDLRSASRGFASRARDRQRQYWARCRGIGPPGAGQARSAGVPCAVIRTAPGRPVRRCGTRQWLRADLPAGWPDARPADLTIGLRCGRKPAFTCTASVGWRREPGRPGSRGRPTGFGVCIRPSPGADELVAITIRCLYIGSGSAADRRTSPAMSESAGGAVHSRSSALHRSISTPSRSRSASSWTESFCVLAAHVTRRGMVRNIRDHLDDLNIPLLGLILNDRTFPIPKAVYRLL